ncbi:diacylglycerol/polyprenol kinase family protein [Chlorobium sp. KB01]|uniref:diacylglycerol/polyprenol kinase family protein n=1 Tax=Chlorobium sp. KB01 TaxID=1917528 RepID=UPI0009786083|nr:diacylglycerol/polyprenol kinase family protein [Chlorobium sp. KB01]
MMPVNKEAIDRLELRYEVARKAIHLSSLSIPVIYYFITRELALLLLLPLFAGFFLVDLLKNFVPPVSKWYHKTFDSMLRTHEIKGEKNHLNGATCITLSALLLVLFFPKIIAIAAFSMVAVSDTLAAIIGKAFGKHRFGQKSIEGSMAFFLSALLIMKFIPEINPGIGFAMALVATVTESFVLRIGSFRIDDNLSIPLVSATFGTLCYMLFLPGTLAFFFIGL